MTAREDIERVSVVVPTFRRPEALRTTLAALAAVEHPSPRLEVIVVDDGADELTEKVVRERQGGPISIEYASQAQLGAATARNLGARMAGGDLVVFCDDDVIVEADHLRRHLATRARHGDPIVSGVSSLAAAALAAFQATAFGRFRMELDRRFEEEADGRPLGHGRFEASFLSARNLALSRSLFWELGGFDETFPFAGAEDQDLSLRARHEGRLLIRDQGIRVGHNEQILTLEQFCAREERGARTVVRLERKFPGEGAQRRVLLENDAIHRRDRPSLVGKKLAKSLLARAPALTAAHRVVGALERAPVGDPARHRLYRGLIGLHMFRGVRAELGRGR